MPAVTNVICPDCEKHFRVNETSLGKQAKCRNCGASFTLETQGDETADTSLGSSLSRPAAVGKPGPPPADLGRYIIRQRLGAGAFGAVYRAYDPVLEREVALKVPHAASRETPEVQKRFMRESKAAAQLRHQNIVPIHDVGFVDDQCFIVSSFIEGRTLADELRARELNVHEAVELAAKLADALHYAHQQGIVHRDVKPGNVIIDDKGEPLLLDFGLAQWDESQTQLTQQGAILGTPGYMSPEQAGGGGEIGPASDQYSLACVLYEMLCGRPPFQGPVMSVIYQHRHETPPPPTTLNANVPPLLERICLKALAKQPLGRYENLEQMARMLRRVGASKAAVKPPLPAAKRQNEPATDTIGTAAVTEQPHRAVISPAPSALPPAPQREKLHRSMRRPRVAGVAAAALGLFVTLGVIVHVATNHGTIQIEIVSEDKSVKPDNLTIEIDGDTVTLADLDDPIKLRAKKHRIHVESEGFETLTERFVVKRGENEKLVVTLEASDSPASRITKAVGPSLVLVQQKNGGRRTLGVVTDFGICTVHAGRFTAVDIVSLYNQTRVEGTVESRNPFPFCWVHSDELTAPKVALAPAGSSKQPQQAFFVRATDVYTGTVNSSGWFVPDLPSASLPNSGPLFNRKGECLGCIFRSGATDPLRIYELNRRKKSATQNGAASLPSQPWLGYEMRANPEDVDLFANHTNLVFDRGWADYGGALLEQAKAAGLKTVVYFDDPQAAESQAISQIEKHRDNIVAVCWEGPYFSGSPDELNKFGESLKSKFPGIQLWISVVEKEIVRKPSLVIPDEVDVVLVTHYNQQSAAELRRHAAAHLPSWIEKASGRPVLLRRTASRAHQGGNVPGTAADTFLECGRIAQDYELAGVVFAHFSSTYNVRGYTIQPINSNPALVAAVRSVARSLEILPADSAAVTRLSDDLSQWTPMRTSGRNADVHRAGQGGWTASAGVIHCATSTPGWLRSNEQYGDFELSLEFRLPAGGNSGVYIRTPEHGHLSRVGMEVQIIDDDGLTVTAENRTGAIHRAAPSSESVFRGGNQWNAMTVRCVGEHVQVTLNGTDVVDVQMDKTPALASRPRMGFIGLSNWQGQANGAEFRYMKIRRVGQD